MPEPFLELVDISKTYPGVVALDHADLAVSRGEVIALIGENGAGKSTLMRVLGGVVEPSGGVIRIDGVERRSLTVADAIKAGIAFVHQELNLFDNLDVAGNVYIGREPVYGGPLKLIDRNRLHVQVRPLLDPVDPDDAVVRLDHAAKHAHQGRLAGAVLADKGNHLAARHCETGVVECDHAGIALADIDEFEEVVRH